MEQRTDERNEIATAIGREQSWETVDVERRVDEEMDEDEIRAEFASRTDRLQVPGGWIYRYRSFDSSEERVAMVFVPDGRK